VSVEIRSRTSQQRRERERRRRQPPKKKYTIVARYRYTTHKRIQTEDTGTFRQLWAKYKDTATFWCADIPPVDEKGNRDDEGFRLNEDSLKPYGNHKAWIEEGLLIDGKPVILVFNAGFQKGCIPWNKDLKGYKKVPHTAEAKEKIRAAAKINYWKTNIIAMKLAHDQLIKMRVKLLEERDKVIIIYADIKGRQHRPDIIYINSLGKVVCEDLKVGKNHHLETTVFNAE